MPGSFLFHYKLFICVKCRHLFLYVQQLVGATLEQIVVDIAQIGVLLRDAQRARGVRLEDGLGALSLALVAGGGLVPVPNAEEVSVRHR